MGTGNHTLSVEVTNPNNQTDENSNNNIANESITVVATPETAVYVTVSLLTDDYAEETYMEITNSVGNVIWSEGNENIAGDFDTGNANPDPDPTNPFENNTAYEWDVPLSSAECYTFTIYDYYGDGIDSEQWGGTNGDLELLDNFGSVIYALADPNFEGEESSVIKNATVGLESSKPYSISLYPNPATNYVVIKSESINCFYEVTDLSGKCLSSGKIEAYETSFPTDGWSSGTYFIKVFGVNLDPVIGRFTVK